MESMEEIVFGTRNEAKVRQVAGALRPIGVRVKGLPEGAPLPAIEEDGETAGENARKKALAYSLALGTPVLSMDNALYFKGLHAGEQPGVHVRRIGNGDERPSDEALLEYYASLIGRLGGKVEGRWEFGICVATPQGKTKGTTILSPRIFTAVPSARMVPGYPLESLQIDPVSGKCVSDMTQEEQDAFWQRAIGKPLQEFVRNIEL